MKKTSLRPERGHKAASPAGGRGLPRSLPLLPSWHHQPLGAYPPPDARQLCLFLRTICYFIEPPSLPPQSPMTGRSREGHQAWSGVPDQEGCVKREWWGSRLFLCFRACPRSQRRPQVHWPRTTVPASRLLAGWGSLGTFLREQAGGGRARQDLRETPHGWFAGSSHELPSLSPFASGEVGSRSHPTQVHCEKRPLGWAC